MLLTQTEGWGMPHPLNQLQNIRRAFNFQPWERNVLLRLQMNYVRNIDHSPTLPDSNTRNNTPAVSPSLFVFGMPEGWCGDCLVVFQSCDLLLASPIDHLTNHNLQTIGGVENNIYCIWNIFNYSDLPLRVCMHIFQFFKKCAIFSLCERVYI